MALTCSSTGEPGVTWVPVIPSADLGNGVSMPMVGLGTWQLRGRQGYDAVRYALQAGYRHLDTATIYRNEEEVGQAVLDSGLARDEVFITTKLPMDNAGRERATLEASLKALGTSYVDLWLVHRPPPGSLVPVWREFLALRAEGLCRAVGVSNASVAHVDEITKATGEPPAVNQVPWSPSRHDPDALAEFRSRGVVVEGYSPLKDTRLDNPALASVAAAHGVTPAQVVLRWHLEHGIVVIPKSGRDDRIEANFAVTGFSLSPEEVARIDRL
jgi:2,5-diketo-D-gluconate reductase A